MRPSLVERARFSSSTAPFTMARNASSTPFSSAHDSERMSTSMLTLEGMELTEVPPRTAPMLYVVFGVAGTWMSENRAIAAAMAYAGFTRPKAP